MSRSEMAPWRLSALLGRGKWTRYALSMGKAHVASTPRVRVGEPSATDICSLLNQCEITMAMLLHELDGQSEARHACPDDEDFRIYRSHYVVIIAESEGRDSPERKSETIEGLFDQQASRLAFRVLTTQCKSNSSDCSRRHLPGPRACRLFPSLTLSPHGFLAGRLWGEVWGRVCREGGK